MFAIQILIENKVKTVIIDACPQFKNISPDKIKLKFNKFYNILLKIFILFSKEEKISVSIFKTKKPKPNIKRFLDAMLGKIILDKPPIVEFIVDKAVMQPITENIIGKKWVDAPFETEYMGGLSNFLKKDIENLNSWLDNQILFWYHMGYDYVLECDGVWLPATSIETIDTADKELRRKRSWQAMRNCQIETLDDFEKYPWPEVTEANFYIPGYISDHLPDGLGFMTYHAYGIFEHTSRLMGYENLCINLIENPPFVKMVVDKVGDLIYQYYKNLLELDNISAIFQGEDLGFNTQTLISPNDLKTYFLPWHKKYAKLFHEKNKPYFLHSCGKIDVIMEDLINDVKIDGKHSFQDGVAPINEAKDLWGDRICLLGGVDIDKLSRLDPENLRKYIRKIIDYCSPGGRFAIGSGNSIPSYIPIENYLTMLNEALK